MIGVIANPSDHDVVREFFELFKTPWEFYRGEQGYEVLLCAGGGQMTQPLGSSSFTRDKRRCSDDERKLQIGLSAKSHSISRTEEPNPNLWGHRHLSGERDGGLLADEESRQCVAYLAPLRRKGSGADRL